MCDFQHFRQWGVACKSIKYNYGKTKYCKLKNKYNDKQGYVEQQDDVVRIGSIPLFVNAHFGKKIHMIFYCEYFA